MARIEILKPGDEARLESFLLPRMESSLFLLSNSRAAGLVDRGRRFEGTYYAASSGGRITGVVAHYWQGNLVVQAPEHLAELLEAVSAAAERPIQGLLGPAAQVGRARELLGVSDARVQMDDQEGLFALDLEEMIVPENLRSGPATTTLRPFGPTPRSATDGSATIASLCFGRTDKPRGVNPGSPGTPGASISLSRRPYRFLNPSGSGLLGQPCGALERR